MQRSGLLCHRTTRYNCFSTCTHIPCGFEPSQTVDTERVMTAQSHNDRERQDDTHLFLCECAVLTHDEPTSSKCVFQGYRTPAQENCWRKVTSNVKAWGWGREGRFTRFTLSLAMCRQLKYIPLPKSSRKEKKKTESKTNKFTVNGTAQPCLLCQDVFLCGNIGIEEEAQSKLRSMVSIVLMNLCCKTEINRFIYKVHTFTPHSGSPKMEANTNKQ